MIEFNPDGSLKLPGHVQQAMSQNEQKMKSQRCIKIAKKIVSFDSPKKCVLKITLSNAMNDNRFIHTIYDYFRQEAAVPTKINKINDREFEVEVGTDFRRCTDCCSLVGRYKEFLDGNLIEEKGSCTFEGFKKNFEFEDYFD